LSPRFRKAPVTPSRSPFLPRLPFGIRHGGSINVHSGLNAGMTHELLLNGHRCAAVVEPCPVRVTESMPAQRKAELGFFSCRFQETLLDLFLMIRSARHRVLEYPFGQTVRSWQRSPLEEQRRE